LNAGQTVDRYKLKIVGSPVASLPMADLRKLQIPLPSLEEQARIVAILDKFDTLTTDITSGLPAEIEARNKQYEYYRDKLLSFKEASA
jgi:type I restriction enzyme S subunit